MRCATTLLVASLAACQPRAAVVAPTSEVHRVEAMSWLGRPLHARPLTPDVRADFEQKLERARADLAASPDDPDLEIWVGRRLAYLGRFGEAIATYDAAIEEHPDHAPLYRHRGHRHISTRNLGAARADLERAARLIEGTEDVVEADGLPNARNLPTSTLHTNVWYHLGLVYFLQGEWELAAGAYRSCLAAARNDDMRVATLYWLHMTLRRMGRHDDARGVLAPIRADMDIIENTAYHQLVRMFAGQLDAERFERDALAADEPNPALLFGIANRHLVEGRTDRAYELWQQVVDTLRWDAFGTIAAEAELVRRNPHGGAVPSDAGPPPFDLQAEIAPWVGAWNRYDLTALAPLFVRDARLTYYSSEKPGRLQGLDAILDHHRGFGFVPGGKAPDPTKALWLDDLHAQPHGSTAVVTGTWFFGDRSAEDPQRGPVTFVFVHDEGRWRIAHAHFANAPTPAPDGEGPPTDR